MSRRTRLIIFITVSAVFMLGGWAIIQGVRSLLLTAAFTVLGAIVGLLQILFPMPLLTTLTSRSPWPAVTKPGASPISRIPTIKRQVFARKISLVSLDVLGIGMIVFWIFDTFIPGALLYDAFDQPWFLIIYIVLVFTLTYTYDPYDLTTEKIRREKRRGIYTTSVSNRVRPQLPFIVVLSLTTLGSLYVGWHYGPSVLGFLHFWYLPSIIGAFGAALLLSPINLYLIGMVSALV